VLLRSGSLTAASFIALVALTFFFASAGASSAYLTVSEVFPLETRALAIAFFFAVGTAIGGISGPAIFGHLIHSGDADKVALGFFIGAGVMTLGGLAELAFGIPAERRSLEAIAKPLSAADTEGAGRVDSRRERERSGARRFRPGPGTTFYSPGMAGTAGAACSNTAVSDRARDREVEAIAHALEQHDGATPAELEVLVGGRAWGPGRFRIALRVAVVEGRATRAGRSLETPSPRA
jgi:MFS family permease